AIWLDRNDLLGFFLIAVSDLPPVLLDGLSPSASRPSTLPAEKFLLGLLYRAPGRDRLFLQLRPDGLPRGLFAGLCVRTSPSSNHLALRLSGHHARVRRPANYREHAQRLIRFRSRRRYLCGE